MSVKVPSVSVAWMKNRNKCDTKGICSSAHPAKAFHASSKLPLHNNTEKVAAHQQIQKTTLMRRELKTCVVLHELSEEQKRIRVRAVLHGIRSGHEIWKATT